MKCRSPMMFLAERWRHGRAGALELGGRHGAWCLGCCWALMAALFAVGVMSLGWMALIAAFIAGEKLLPWPRATRTHRGGRAARSRTRRLVRPRRSTGLRRAGGGMHAAADGAGMQMMR